MPKTTPNVLGFAAFSGTGKTTLLKQLIALLTARQLRIAVIKHSHHDFCIDQPGKDSYELHNAGSQQTLLTSRYRSALVVESPQRQEPVFIAELNKLTLDHVDLVLVEGFRHAAGLAKIELHRASLGRPWLYPQDEHILAIATDQTIQTQLPLLDINDTGQISTFIERMLDDGKLAFPLS